jgi:hypothetical protein
MVKNGFDRAGGIGWRLARAREKKNWAGVDLGEGGLTGRWSAEMTRADDPE